MSQIHIATEDELSEAVAIRMIQSVLPRFSIGLKLRRGGFGYLKSSFHKFVKMAQRDYVLVLTDLDKAVCPAKLLAEWIGDSQLPEKLFLRIPVREIESWILADRAGVANLLNVSEAKLPMHPDDLADPKQALLNSAKQASRNVRSDMLSSRGTQGLGYNNLLIKFVSTDWNIGRAQDFSPSLLRTINRLSEIRM